MDLIPRRFTAKLPCKSNTEYIDAMFCQIVMSQGKVIARCTIVVICFCPQAT